MTYHDYETGLDIIDAVLLNDTMSFDERLNLTRDLQLLELSKTECIKLYEHIDKCNTEFNMLCFECRNACEKSNNMRLK